MDQYDLSLFKLLIKEWTKNDPIQFKLQFF